MIKLRWPLPVEYRTITTRHGEGGHIGIDISAPTGQPVYAAHDGIVTREWTQAGGNVARVTGVDCYTRYAHLKSFTVDNGQYVLAGHQIAISDNTGNLTTGPHLHWELHRLSGEALDPLEYVTEVTVSKLGLQFQTYPAWAREIVMHYWPIARNGWVMALDPPLPDLFANTKVLGRVMQHPSGYPSCDAWERDVMRRGSEGGRAYYEFNREYYAARRGRVTAWQFINEPIIWSDQDAANYRDALIAWATQMQTGKYKIVGGVFARGNPELRIVVPGCNYLKIMGPALDQCDYLAYHSYMRGRFDLNDKWETFRYKLIADELVSLGFKRPTWFISECLFDAGGGPKDGWRDAAVYGGNWQLYFADLRAFDAILRKDPDVVHAFIFICGPYEMWRSFEIDAQQAQELGEYVYNDVVPSVLTQADIEAALGAEMQKHIIPLNPNAALEKVAVKQGLLPAGSEFDLAVGGVQYRCQAFRRADERDTQYGLYAKVGDWGNVQQFKREN